ncbi:MAG: hypothetical protein WD602_07535 [Actinomycetota bacterium]
MYEFRWEWVAGNEHKRLFLGQSKEEVLIKVADCLRNEMGVQRPTQTIMRLVAQQIRKSQPEDLPKRWTIRSPFARTYG